MLTTRHPVQPATKGNLGNRPAMISSPNTAPADAYAPEANREGPAMPENIARLLYVVRILLDFGHHLAATIERRAAGPGFWLLSSPCLACRPDPTAAGWRPMRPCLAESQLMFPHERAG